MKLTLAIALLFALASASHLKKVRIPAHLKGTHVTDIGPGAVYAGRDASGHHVYFAEKSYEKTHPSIKTETHDVRVDVDSCVKSQVIVARFAEKMSMTKFQALCRTLKIKSRTQMDFVNKYVVRAEVASVHPEKCARFALT